MNSKEKDRLLMTASVLEVLGLAGVSVGCWLMWPPLGAIAGGAAICAVGLSLAAKASGK